MTIPPLPRSIATRRAWLEKNFSKNRAYRTAWARAHYRSRATTKPCLVCSVTIPARNTYCALCKIATRQAQWITQNNRRKS